MASGVFAHTYVLPYSSTVCELVKMEIEATPQPRRYSFSSGAKGDPSAFAVPAILDSTARREGTDQASASLLVVWVEQTSKGRRVLFMTISALFLSRRHVIELLHLGHVRECGFMCYFWADVHEARPITQQCLPEPSASLVFLPSLTAIGWEQCTTQPVYCQHYVGRRLWLGEAFSSAGTCTVPHIDALVAGLCCCDPLANLKTTPPPHTYPETRPDSSSSSSSAIITLPACLVACTPSPFPMLLYLSQP